MVEKLSNFLATCGGIGHIPVGPGTFGSLVALIWVIAFYPDSPGVQISSIVITFILGVWSSAQVSKQKGHPDPPYVVIDEVCGIFLTFLFVSVTPASLALGFAIFRMMDIFKLPFIRRLETLPGGYGIMLDDVAAGILSNVLLRALLKFAS